MAKREEKTIVSCDFDGGLRMPKICVSCGANADEKRYKLTATDSLKHNKIKINFPVCDACNEADQNYVNAVPVTVFGILALALSIFSLFHGSEKIPSGIYLWGGILWMAIIVVYVVWTNVRAHWQNTPEIITRRNKLQKAIRVNNFIAPHRNSTGQIVLIFTNAHFANAFKGLNKGKIIKK